MTTTSRSQRLDAIVARTRIIPTITVERVDDAVPLARALIAGGLPVIEVMLRSAAAPDAIAAIASAVPDAIVGAGTVMTASDLDRAMRLGAHFAVSPGTSPELLAAATRLDLPLIPGAATASEVMQAVVAGFDVVKFFPAAPLGIPALRALCGPFPGVRFCPTGGIGPSNARDWLAVPAVAAVGGTWITPAAEVDQRDWPAITARARAAVAAATQT